MFAFYGKRCLLIILLSFFHFYDKEVEKLVDNLTILIHPSHPWNSLVSFSSLQPNTWENQSSGGQIGFGSWFSHFIEAGWPHYFGLEMRQNITAEGLLISRQPKQRQRSSKAPGLGPWCSPQEHASRMHSLPPHSVTQASFSSLSIMNFWMAWSTNEVRALLIQSLYWNKAFDTPASKGHTRSKL